MSLLNANSSAREEIMQVSVWDVIAERLTSYFLAFLCVYIMPGMGSYFLVQESSPLYQEHRKPVAHPLSFFLNPLSAGHTSFLL